MSTHTFGLRLVGVFAALTLTMGLFVYPAHAQLITQAQVDEQKRVVMVEIVGALEEQVKLLQMIFIRQLEAQIVQLQAQADAQSAS